MPFEDIYTSVFALLNGNKLIIFDTATTESDVKTVILPAINILGIEPDFIVCSHQHGDHCGGMRYLLKAYPKAVAALYDKNIEYKGHKTVHLNDGDILLDRFMVLNLKGHTKDSIAFYDLKNKTLISADCLQLNGVSKYGTGVSDYNDYIETLKRVKSLRINNIIAAHDFVPLGNSAFGSCAVDEYLKECENSIENICEFVRKNNMLSNDDIVDSYNLQNAKLPPINIITIISIKKQLL